ncbi:hypothetical protein ACLB2K_025537 [Fragaria x ananassa]
MVNPIGHFTLMIKSPPRTCQQWQPNGGWCTQPLFLKQKTYWDSFLGRKALVFESIRCVSAPPRSFC